MSETINDNQELSNIVPIKTAVKRNKKDTQFKVGNPGGPGRPKGKTIKEQVREWLETHPDDNAAFVKHFIKTNRDLAWQMLEGRPAQDLTSGGEKINPIPIYGGLSNNDSNPKDIQPQEENPSS